MFSVYRVNDIIATIKKTSALPPDLILDTQGNTSLLDEVLSSTDLSKPIKEKVTAELLERKVACTIHSLSRAVRAEMPLHIVEQIFAANPSLDALHDRIFDLLAGEFYAKTPLANAVSNRQLDVAQFLLTRGASPLYTGTSSRMAVYLRDRSMAQLILDAITDDAKRQEFCNDGLRSAYSNKDLFMFFLENNADPFYCPKPASSQLGSFDIEKSTFEFIIRKNDDDGRVNSEVLEFLWNIEPSENFKAACASILRSAILDDNDAKVTYLLSKNVSPFWKNPGTDRNAIEHCYYNRNYKYAALLWAAIKPEEHTSAINLGKDLILFSISKNNIDLALIKILLSGSEIVQNGILDLIGKSLILHAINNIDLFKFLLSCTPDILNGIDNRYALSNTDDASIAQLILDAMPQPDREPLCKEILEGSGDFARNNLELFKVFLNTGVDIFTPDDLGQSIYGHIMTTASENPVRAFLLSDPAIQEMHRASSEATPARRPSAPRPSIIETIWILTLRFVRNVMLLIQRLHPFWPRDPVQPRHPLGNTPQIERMNTTLGSNAISFTPQKASSDMPHGSGERTLAPDPALTEQKKSARAATSAT